MVPNKTAIYKSETILKKALEKCVTILEKK